MKKPQLSAKPALTSIARPVRHAWQIQTSKARFGDVKSHHPKSIVQFFRESPLVGIDLDLERDKDTGREIEL